MRKTISVPLSVITDKKDAVRFPACCVYCGAPEETKNRVVIRATKTEQVGNAIFRRQNYRAELHVPLCKKHKMETTRNKIVLSLGTGLLSLIPPLLLLAIVQLFPGNNAGDAVNGFLVVLFFVLLVASWIAGLIFGTKFTQKAFSRRFPSIVDSFLTSGVVGLVARFSLDIRSIDLSFSNAEIAAQVEEMHA